MGFGSARTWVNAVLGVVLIASVGSDWGVTHALMARAESCGGVIAIVNGGFESPDLPGGPRQITPDGWSSTGTVFLWDEGSRPDNPTQFASVIGSASLSQTIVQPELEGSTATITFSASAEFDRFLIRFGNHDQRIHVSPGFAAYTVTVGISEDDRGPYTLGFQGLNANSVEVDNVAVAFAKPCPTPAPTQTPISVPTAEPTGVPTETPGEEVEITITGDPRYPVSGSVELDIPGLSYVLVNKPDQGRVVLYPDGSFTYTAASRWLMFDQFAVLASNDTLITVNLVLQIDPPVPEFGEGSPADTGTGDLDKFTQPQPTSTLDEDAEICDRCN